MEVHKFVFNLFMENTYLLVEDGKGLIIDPGNSNDEENHALKSFIEQNEIEILALINTHCHIDHILGNRTIKESYEIPFYAPFLDEYNLIGADQYASELGLEAPRSPKPEIDLNEMDTLKIGPFQFEVLFTPGHTSGHVCLYNEKEKRLFSGDVLFNGSIGRTDLPGGNFDTLINSIKEKLLSLADETIVYSGHGPETSIGYERKSNPFLLN